ncbi:reticulon-like protein B21 isoform X2 [Glycine soja]|uniref:reticulon-like protein B21 isoform X2 n=1 Tax=Glycine max TaxID=3847 RepID=UPI0003DEB087|nr:reticulon-like protein B21 isoform X2 [Glycine max]XP_028211568.1 reticulon-like protein B21 isoform X2 [Glycine soja]|eukprot:XP_006600547.1 reticulon-like protein B21 isoform X2 [Glycine max]
MDVSRRRLGVRCSVVAGSVWESRMKSDEVGGGVKVFTGEQSAEEGGNGGTCRLKRSQIGSVVATGKRKTWKSEGLENNHIQIAIGKSEPQKNGGNSSSSQQCKDLNISSDSIKKSPIQARKKRSGVGESFEKNAGKLRKNKSDLIKNVGDGDAGNAIQPRKGKSELDHVLDESRNDGLAGGSARVVILNGKNDCDENCKDFGVCLEKVISSNSGNVGMIKCSPVHVDDDDEDDVVEEEVDDEEIDIEMEKGSFDVKEISVPESKVVNETERKEVVNVAAKQKIVNEPEPKKVVSTNRQFHQKNERPVSVPISVKPSLPIRKLSTIHQNFSKADSIPKAEEYCSFPQSQNKLQSLVDLIMWRDISRSAFIFGIGTFAIVLSSYAKDINLSLISVMSYIGLVYLAVIFLYRSLICRGVIDVEDTNYVLREEEAIWVLKLILPYLNEFLSKLRAMFSGDPGTTIKLAVLLFVLARCGSYITIWKMAKFGFFGVFTVPKICSSYSAQLTAFANFWIRRFRDAWDSCSHKKAVALGIFGLVWNLSSVVARIWSDIINNIIW